MSSSHYSPHVGTSARPVMHAEIPIEQRLRALRRLARLELLATDTERAVLLALALYPPDRLDA